MTSSIKIWIQIAHLRRFSEKASKISRQFWTRYPGLYYGLLLTLGAFLVYTRSPYCCFPLLCLFLMQSGRQSIQAFLLLVAYLSLLHLRAPPDSGHHRGLMRIESATSSSRGTFYRGKLFIKQPLHCSFLSTAPCRIGGMYWIEGTLSSHHLTLAKPPEPAWALPSLISLRQKAKRSVLDYLQSVFPNPHVSAFLGGLLTGSFSEKNLKPLFCHLGLAHLLAISGFHFSLIAFFLSLFLQFFSLKMRTLLLLTLATGYFLFLGYSPAIHRAWIGVLLFYGSHLLEKPTAGLNRLGIALLIGILFDPQSVLSASFQLSYLATGSLLLFFRPIDSALQLIIPKRPFSALAQRSLLFQHLYIARSLLRSAFALSLAVNLCLLPLCLDLFHQFPLHGVLYNLFFPPLVAFSLFLALLATALHGLLPPLGKLLHLANNFFTQGILHCAENPLFPSKTLYSQSLPEGFLPIYLTLLALVAIYLHSRKSSCLLQNF